MGLGLRGRGLIESESLPSISVQVKDDSHIMLWMASKITHNEYETSCRFWSHPQEYLYASGSISSLKMAYMSCFVWHIIYGDLRANILVACKVTPAIWLNLSDSRNILIIHFGLLLKERTLDSIGHDLWKNYNVICLLWMICYISLLTNIFTQWILIGA